MSGTRRLQIEILGDAKGLSGAFGAAESAAGKFGNAIGTAARVAGAAVFGIGAAAVGGAAIAINAASDLGESINAVNVTFGDAANGILELSESAATAVGLSAAQFNGLAVQFSSFATTVAGEGGDVVATMDDLTTRAADFASVMNIDVSEAAAMFQSGLAGETEPLRRFGLDLSAAAVEAFAYANGITEVGEQLTETEKVQARYGLLMEQTAEVQGDFANTSDSMANQQRILKATFADLAANIGTALLPAVVSVLGFVSEHIIPTLQEFLPRAVDVASRWFNEHLRPAIEAVVDWVVEHWPEIQEVIGAVWAKLGELWGWLSENVLSPLGDALGEIVDWVERNWETISTVVSTVFDAIGETINFIVAEVFPRLVDAATWTVNAISWAWTNVLYPMFAWFRTVLQATAEWMGIVWARTEVFRQLLAGGFAEAVGRAAEHLGAARLAFERLFGWVSAVFGKTESLRDLFLTGMGSAVEVFKTAMRAVKAVIDPVIAALQTAWELLQRLTNRDGPAYQVGPVWDGTPATGGSVVRHHSGGVVGGMNFGGLRPDEVATVLQEGEVVLTSPQLSAVMSGGGGTTVNNWNITPPPSASDPVAYGRQLIDAILTAQRATGQVLALA